MRKQKKNTWLFIGFLLFAGFTNTIGRFLPVVWDAAMGCIHYLIYTGLLIFWLEAVRIRLLPSRARTYMIFAAYFMLLYMFLRFFKYSFAVTAAAARYATYAYWAPQMLISTLFFMTCIRIRHGEQTNGTWNEALLLLPAALLAVTAMTNDLHHLVYLPQISLSQFTVVSGTYGYGFVFYLMNAWMILTVFAGLIVLLTQAGQLPRGTILFLAGDIVLWFGFLLLTLLILDPYTNIKIFNVPEASIFGMLGIYEISIRKRLIPCNENYTGFFETLRMPVRITDRTFHPIYASAGTLQADSDHLRAALQKPVYPDPDHKLSGKEIHAGYAFWMEDETEIHKSQERLLEANEMIAQENTLMEAETKQTEEHARLTTHHRIYHEIAEEMYPVQQHIAKLLQEAVPGTQDFRDHIARVCVLNAYVKRKTNLLLLASEKEVLSIYELYLAMEESAEYLTYRNLKVSVREPEENALPAKDVIDLYDTFGRITQQLIGHASSVMISWTKGGFCLAAQTDRWPEMEEVPIPVACHEHEGILYMDIRTQKGGTAV